MNSITTHTIVSNLRKIFSRLGFSSVLIFDNSTQFTSSVFADFNERFGVKYIRSSLHNTYNQMDRLKG